MFGGQEAGRIMRDVELEGLDRFLGLRGHLAGFVSGRVTQCGQRLLNLDAALRGADGRGGRLDLSGLALGRAVLNVLRSVAGRRAAGRRRALLGFAFRIIRIGGGGTIEQG